MPLDPPTPTAKTERLLLVDDNLTNLQVLYQALEAEGYELLVAQSGQEALATADKARPDLILLDINMPGMDGYETCRRIREHAEIGATPVIFLSARGDAADKVKGLDLGAVDYIEKPFEFEEVVARVRAHLGRSQAHERLSRENQELKQRLDSGFRDLGEQDLAGLLAAGETDHIEFKSTLRMNLHSKKADKRIENACLKTVAAYLNSDGGILLVGIDDDGTVVGMSPDHFASDDKLLLHWNGLLRTHLGPETAHWIRSTVLWTAGKQIMLVQCQRSDAAIFLARDNEETFYIRTGNRTEALKPREMMVYLERRQTSPEA
jgi:putative two-component system response regulator